MNITVTKKYKAAGFLGAYEREGGKESLAEKVTRLAGKALETCMGEVLRFRDYFDDKMAVKISVTIGDADDIDEEQ